MKFKIENRVYNAASIDELSLKDILQLESETTALGRPLRMNDFKVMSEEIDALKTDAEKQAHPDAPWVLAVTIWASRREQGETMTFGDAIDFPLKQLTFLPEPQDHKVKANPTKARPRKGSSRAANSQHDDQA